MPYQDISAELNEAVKQEIIKLINQITERLPFLINLTPEERITIPKMGDKTNTFVDKALDFALQNPNLVPPFLNIEELRKDFSLSENLRSVANALNGLAEKVNDTYLAVGSEAYTAALVFYNSSKNAAKRNVPGTDTIVNELGKRFERQKKGQQEGS